MKFRVLILLTLFIFCSVANAGLYRWVDENGKVSYSDSVPPSKSQRGHTELDELGNHVDKVEAAKSKEVAEEEQWLAGLEKQLEVKQKQRAREDSMLLNSFATLEQFDVLRDSKLKALSDSSQQLELLRGKLVAEFERLSKQLKASKSAGAKKRIQGFIATNQDNTATYDLAIKQNEKETKALLLATGEQRKRLAFLLKKMANKTAENKVE